jgi:hypothetical protein
VAIFIVMALLQNLDGILRKDSTSVELYIEYDRKIPLSIFLSNVRQNDLDIVELELTKNNLIPDTCGAATITIQGKQKNSHDIILDLVKNTQGIIFFMELY